MTPKLYDNIEPLITPIPGAWWVVFGLGATGLSCARFLSERSVAVTVVDTRDNPPQLAALQRELPEVEVCCGQFPLARLLRADGWLLSPGVPLDHPAVNAARQANIPLLGDVELFARYATAPYVGITGSNGKSTVTTLVAEMIAAGGRLAAAGANLGTPALDLLASVTPDYYVLELSSFQLEITDTLAPVCAAILNLSADHLDRHHNFEAYAAAKARILRHADCAVLNADDPHVAAFANHFSGDMRWVSLDSTKNAAYTIEQRENERWLCVNDQAVIRCAALRIKGTHNEFNALAALAITDSIHVSRKAQVDVLQRFTGLAHRCRFVAERDGISWFNDSKGTNIGAAAASIIGIFNSRRGVLIAGGQSKGADFRELRAALIDRVHSVVLIGEDAPQIEAAVKGVVDVHHAFDMRGAVAQAAQLSRPGDAVLLSPACASFDMFRNYAARGWAFEAAVRELLRQ